MAKAPHSVTVPLYRGQIHVIRDVNELKNRARKVFSRRGKAQIPTCLFLPHRGERCLGNKRFKLIPTIVSASETFFQTPSRYYAKKTLFVQIHFDHTGLHGWQMHKYKTGELGAGVQVIKRQVCNFTSELFHNPQLVATVSVLKSHTTLIASNVLNLIKINIPHSSHSSRM